MWGYRGSEGRYAQVHVHDRCDSRQRLERNSPRRLGCFIRQGFLLALVFIACSQLANAQVLPTPPEHPTTDANGVDVVNGSLSLPPRIDLSIGPEGTGGLKFAEYFNSSAGWRNSFSNLSTSTPDGLVPVASVAIGNEAESFAPGPVSGTGSSFDDYSGRYITRDGRVVHFDQFFCSVTQDGPSSPNPDPYGDPIPGPTTTTTYRFASSIEYPNGDTVYLHYKTRPWLGCTGSRLQSAVSNHGYQIKFSYQSNNSSDPETLWAQITSAVAINNAVEYCDPDADSCSLANNWPTATYSSNSVGTVPSITTTSQVTDALGRVTTYVGHSGSGSDTYSIRTPGHASDNIAFTLAPLVNPCLATPVDPGLVFKVTSATVNGMTTNYSHTSSAYGTVVTATDSLSHATAYSSLCAYGATSSMLPQFGRVVSQVDPLNRQTQFTYDQFGRVTMATSPEGNHTNFTYDSSTTATNGDIVQTTVYPKSGSGLANIVTTNTFTTCTNTNYKICNKPISVVDPNGNQTDYTYDPNHGGVLTETLPAVNGIRPQKRYSYQQFTAYVKNASGVVVPASAPVWLPTQVAECRTQASCSGGADEVITRYEYGPAGVLNNLLLRGKVVSGDGTSLRTCYAYDALGNKISETTPRANLSSCP